MEAYQLVKGAWYFSALHGNVKYIGTKEYRGETHHEFYEPRFKLLHWLLPQEVKQV